MCVCVCVCVCVASVCACAHVCTVYSEIVRLYTEGLLPLSNMVIVPQKWTVFRECWIVEVLDLGISLSGRTLHSTSALRTICYQYMCCLLRLPVIQPLCVKYQSAVYSSDTTCLH